MTRRKTAGEAELEEHGFLEVRLVRNGRTQWYTAKDGNEEICFLRMGRGTWHAFYAYRATGSGGDPRRALNGGLGDVIDDHWAMKGYCAAVLRAPDALVRKFDGLYAAGTQVLN